MVDLINGDCIEEMQRLIDEGVQVDSVVTDPPYHLTSIVKRYGKPDSAPAKDRDGLYQRQARGFMGKEWDGGDIAFRKETWELAYELLKPGGHLLAFSASRNYHRMAVAIEDAGFEIRDQLMWLYGSGFPKSYNIGKGMDKKLGNEREVVGKGKAGAAFHYGAVGDGGFGNTFDGNGTASSEWETTQGKSEWEGWGTALKPAHEPIVMARKPISEKSIADNVSKHGTGGINIDGCRVKGKDNPVKWTKPRGGIWKTDSDAKAELVENKKGRFPANVMHDGLKEDWAKFFYSPKTSKSERNQGLDDFETKMMGMSGGAQNKGEGYDKGQGIGLNRVIERKNTHPTVKPIELMKYLCRLVTPKGGIVLDPFMGSGSTGVAAKDEGFDFIGIEREKEYFEICKSRIEKSSPLMEFFE